MPFDNKTGKKGKRKGLQVVVAVSIDKAKRDQEQRDKIRKASKKLNRGQ